MLILALDPGRTTGYALAETYEGVIGYDQAAFSHGDLWRFIPPLVDAVICESFEFRHGKQLGVDLYPCELIGVVKLWIEGTVELYMQNPSIQGKKAYFSDQMLKDLGLYLKGVEHGRSAVKHLLYWLQFAQGSKYGINIEKFRLVDAASLWAVT